MEGWEEAVQRLLAHLPSVHLPAGGGAQSPGEGPGVHVGLGANHQRPEWRHLWREGCRVALVEKP